MINNYFTRRGLAQNKNLVSVVGAVRNVLQAINEDAKLCGKFDIISDMQICRVLANCINRIGFFS